MMFNPEVEYPPLLTVINSVGQYRERRTMCEGHITELIDCLAGASPGMPQIDPSSSL